MKIEVGDKLVFKGSDRGVSSQWVPGSVWEVEFVGEKRAWLRDGGVWEKATLEKEFEPLAREHPLADELADEPIHDAVHHGQQKDEPAHKHDSGKPRMDLIAPEFLSATATVLAYGAAKYDERNWEKGMSWGRVFGAMMRHMWSWWSGEAKDAETGYSHLWHAACCLMFLIAYEERKIGSDDRKNPVDNS